jgi:hypothetical protein
VIEVVPPLPPPGGVLPGDVEEDDDLVLVAIFLGVGGDPTTISLRIEVPGPGGDAMGGRGSLGFMVICGVFRGNVAEATCGLSEGGGGGGGGTAEKRGGDDGPRIRNVSVVLALVGMGDAPVIVGLVKDRIELERRFMEEMDRNESWNAGGRSEMDASAKDAEEFDAPLRTILTNGTTLLPPPILRQGDKGDSKELLLCCVELFLRMDGVGGVLTSVKVVESNNELLCADLRVEGVGGVLKSAMASTAASMTGICGMLGEEALLWYTDSRTCQAGDKGLSYNAVLAVL